MVISLVLFIIGKPWYRVNPANGTVITDFGKCIYVSNAMNMFSDSHARLKKEIRISVL